VCLKRINQRDVIVTAKPDAAAAAGIAAAAAAAAAAAIQRCFLRHCPVCSLVNRPSGP